MTPKTLTLVKGEHKYVLRYEAGSEDDMVTELMRLADDPRTNLDWLDAATLSFQVAHGAAADCFQELGAAAWWQE